MTPLHAGPPCQHSSVFHLCCGQVVLLDMDGLLLVCPPKSEESKLCGRLMAASVCVAAHHRLFLGHSANAGDYLSPFFWKGMGKACK